MAGIGGSTSPNYSGPKTEARCIQAITVLGRRRESIYKSASSPDAREPFSRTTSTMLRPRDALVCGLLVWGGASSVAPPSAAAVALGESGSSDVRAQKGRKLTGRFLHVTGGFLGSLMGGAIRTDDRLQISTLIRSTRHIQAHLRMRPVTAIEGLPVSTAQKRRDAIRRIR